MKEKTKIIIIAILIILLLIFALSNLALRLNLDKQQKKFASLCDLTNQEIDLSNSLIDLNNEYQKTFLEPSEQTLFTTKLTPLDCEAL